MTEYGAHVFNTFDSAAMNYALVVDLVGDPDRAMLEADYGNSKEELTSYIQSLESITESDVVPDGFKLVPIEPTEKMIQAACMAQSAVKFNTYAEWAGSLSNGVVEMIRKFEISSYRSMVGSV